MLLEICANSYQSAINAQEAGAHRIELCTELAVGGITPSYGLIKQVIDNLKIPIFVLIRPRSGNFTYSNEEFNTMKHDIQLCKNLGCSGIVSGILKRNNSIDFERIKLLLEFSKPLSFTLHRAFDWTPNPTKTLEQLINLGVDRILTSGQEASAEKGIVLLKQLKKIANNRLIILPGGGISMGNAKLFKASEFKEIHTSASRITKKYSIPIPPMNSQKLFNENIEVYSDIKKIKSILKIINE